jgi:SAM-dependent methyltransferase
VRLLVREARHLARGRANDIPRQVADVLDRVHETERLSAELLGIELRSRRMLDVGAGQLLLQMAYFAQRNDVVGIDREVIASGLDPRAYVAMLRANGAARVAKTVARKALLIDHRYRRELARRLEVSRMPRLTVLPMDAAAMTFPDSSFDFVYSFAVFQHLRDPAAVLDEMARVLEPGGGLYLDFILHTGRTGSHDVRLLSGGGDEVPLWAHLRPGLRELVQPNAYLNGIRLPDWRAMLEARMPGYQLVLKQPEAEALRPEAEALQREGELADYALEELLTSKVCVLWRKPRTD